MRTREALADAWLARLDAGDLRPSAAAIAAGAGVSVRVVFHHFADLDALFAAVAERQLQRILGNAEPPLLASGPLGRRLDVFLTRRVSLLEKVTPVRRAAVLQEPFSQEVARRLAFARRLARDEVLRAFGPELARLAPAARAEVAEALVVVSSWSSWEALRGHAGLSVRRARAVMRRTLAALLREES